MSVYILIRHMLSHHNKFNTSEVSQKEEKFWLIFQNSIILRMLFLIWLVYPQTQVWLKRLKELWELDHKEGWVSKNWCFWIVVLERTFESFLNTKEFKPVNPKGNQLWVFIGRTDAEAETPILGLPDAKSWLIGRDSDAGKDWRWEEKGITENKMVGWHHWLNDLEFEETLGDREGQGSPACCSLCGHK